MTAREPGVVVCIHGAGLDPRMFHPLATELSLPIVAPRRRAYVGDDDVVGTVPDQARELLGELDRWADTVGADGDVVLVGVSGGATLALAAAIALSAGAAPSRPVRAVIAHEPLIGPLAPELHRTVTHAAERLVRSPGGRGVDRFLRDLVGNDTWDGLPPSMRAFATDRSSTVVADVRRFVEYAPTEHELATLREKFTTTVGEHSPAARLEVGERLGRNGRVRCATVPGAGHLAHWTRPDAFAAIIETAIELAVERDRCTS